MKTKIRLMLLAAFMIAAALPQEATSAVAKRCIPGYCWMVSMDVTCCYDESGCTIVCG